MGSYTHMQNKEGKTIKVMGVKKDDQMYFKGDDGVQYSVPKKMFLDNYNDGTIKIGNLDDKGNFVEYNPMNVGTAKKAAKLMFAPYGTMAKGDWDLKTAGQDALHLVGADIINSAIDELIPNKNTKMKTSWTDGLLGTGLAFAGYKALPSAAHRRIPILNVSDTEKGIKNAIPEFLTKGEAYGATHPSIPITTQGEQKALNREIANSVYRNNPAFIKKVPKSLSDEFVWNTEGKPTSKVVKKSDESRASASGSDKTKVNKQTYEGSQQGGGTENIHTEIRGQKPSDGNLDDLQSEIEEILNGDKKVADNELNLQKTINTEKNSNKRAQNSGTKNIEVEEHNSSSNDVNKNKVDTDISYDLKPFLEDVEGHTAMNLRKDLRDLFENNSDEAKRIANAKSLNELNDIVKNVRTDANDVNVDRWEAAMKEWIPAVNKNVDEVTQGQNLRRDKLKWLDKIEIAGKNPRLQSNLTFTKIPRRGGTVGEYIKSYGESQNPGAKYPIGVGTYFGSRAIPTLRNKDDEMFNAGRPSGDEVFEELRKSMSKKPGLNYVDPNPNKKSKK